MPPAAMRIPGLLRRFSTVREFYDSQSGLNMSVASGLVRLHEGCRFSKYMHDLTSRSSQSTIEPATCIPLEELVTFCRGSEPETVEIDPVSYRLKITNDLSSKGLTNLRILSRVDSIEQAKLLDKSIYKGLVLYYLNEKFVSTKEIISFAKSQKLLVQVKLLTDLSDDSKVIEFASKIADFADAGADHIVVCSGNTESAAYKADDDAIQQLVEESFGLDVAGDPISQRLGFQSENSSEYAVAKGSGITRLFTSRSVDIKELKKLI